MVAALTDNAGSQRSGGRDAGVVRRGRSSWVVVGLGLVSGVAVIVAAYHLASRGNTGAAPYDLFWLGMALAWLPLAWSALRWRHPSPGGALGHVAMMGLLAYVPAFVRAPTRITFYDASAHYAQTERLMRTGALFHPNSTVRMATWFEGLHVLTAPLASLSGLPVYRVGTILIALFPLTTLLGIFTLGYELSHDRRAGLAAALVYAVSPAFSFIDSLFAYESMAIPLATWALTAAVLAARPDGRHRNAFVSASALFAAALVVTHHLTAYSLVALLAVLTVLAALFALRQLEGRASAVAPLAALTALVALGSVAWVVALDIPIVRYLDVYPVQAVDSLRQYLGGPKATALGQGTLQISAVHGLFSGSSLPRYESSPPSAGDRRARRPRGCCSSSSRSPTSCRCRSTSPPEGRRGCTAAGPSPSSPSPPSSARCSPASPT